MVHRVKSGGAAVLEAKEKSTSCESKAGGKCSGVKEEDTGTRGCFLAGCRICAGRRAVGA